jgi:hypothetical protein
MMSIQLLNYINKIAGSQLNKKMIILKKCNVSEKI